ncbi:hypothetical protein K1719_038644 [Acacia pycnantha]|nr:hypothetical protein K1719_038644 [Acacia pycnantha]
MASLVESAWKFLISHFSDFQLACLGSFFLHESVFFLSGLPFLLLERAGWLSKYKIQAKINSPAAQERYLWACKVVFHCRPGKYVHHEYATPFGLTSEYAHPAEILFLGFATIVGPAITGPHLFTLWLWMVVRVLETVEAHCGYHFPWSLSNFLPLYGGADFHDYHHRLLYTKSGNYSSTFTYMDWIFGTDVGYRKLKALKNVGIEENSKEKKQW